MRVAVSAVLCSFFFTLGCGSGEPASMTDAPDPAREPVTKTEDGDSVDRSPAVVAPPDVEPDAPGPDVDPPTTRTENETMPNQTVTDSRNRLGDETSPYLLQHAANPVHWRPWGVEAIEAARAANKPIFLSIGYATCYWCHVMERESFEDEAVAAIMNERFICIKVDREERPDVDDIYMQAVQAMTGQGGWPLNVFIEPEGLQPFFGGTYFPPSDSMGRPGFTSLLRTIGDSWNQRNDLVLQQAQQVGDYVRRSMAAETHRHAVGATEVDLAVNQLMSAYDAADGGFGRGQNKFPTPVILDFLIQSGWDREDVRSALLHTLDRMAMGGMYDQIGGGFHRYSTDRRWLVPHFEKMLYDNGQLASTYAEVYARTEDPYYAEIVRETLDYVLREMTASDGMFFSAQDAEVNHREGQNYLWLEDQVRAALTDAGLADDVDFALVAYGLDRGPNFQDPHHPEDGRKNVIFLPLRPSERAAELGIDQATFDTRIARVNAALLAVRDERDQPITDDKILTGWNGLMIAGFADGGRTLGESRYIDAARRAAEQVLDQMRLPDGSLARTARDGRVKDIHGFLEDYAYLIHGLLALHRATDEDRWLAESVRLADEAVAKFMDERGGAFYDSLADQSDLFVRVKTSYDGATPSGNGLMLNDLVTLAERTADERWVDRSVATVESVSATIAHGPTSCITSMLAIERLLAMRPDALGSSAFVEAEPEGPVSFRPSVKQVALAEGGSDLVHVTMRIKDGFHVTANKPGLDDLIPLAVTLVDGAGVAIEIRYPASEPFTGPDGAAFQVHHGELSIDVGLRRTGPITGKPKLMLTYQVCTEQQCLAPKTVEIGVAIAE